MSKLNVSKKINGKWVNFGNVKPNKFNNQELGLRCTNEFKQLVAEAAPGEWINFALFEEKDKAPERPPVQEHRFTEDAEIPF